MAKLIVRKGEMQGAKAAQPPSSPRPAADTPPQKQFRIAKPSSVHLAGKPPGASPMASMTQQVRIAKQPTIPSVIDDGSSEGRYRIIGILGEGGSGRVCRARDLLLDMDVAIKFLSPSLIRDQIAISALKAETRICLNLVHNHIIRIYNLEKRGANYMLVMELLKGDTLARILAANKAGIDRETAGQIVEIVADALEYAHRHDILHKDITPGNVFVTDDNVVKVIDFGIASVAGTLDDSGEFVFGTPEYMSPEQLRGDPLTAATDTYSLGVLSHALLTGRTLHPAGISASEMAFSPHPPITDVEPPLREVIEKATAFEPADRFRTISEFGSAFLAAACA